MSYYQWREPSESVQRRGLKRLKPIHREIAQRLAEGQRQGQGF